VATPGANPDEAEPGAPGESEEPNLVPGLYAIEEETGLNRLPEGAYAVDEDGRVRRAFDWQIPLQKIQWEKLHEVIGGFGKRGTAERIVNLVGTYVLVGSILGIAAYLASQRIVEGQAIVGFLGAALGYLLAKGRTGGLGHP
jgi:hypothetical protein